MKMTTPIYDFVKSYSVGNTVRAHMPGHKGHALLGYESLDITEIAGADSLYEAEGIINESEQNATRLFETGRTIYSTEGSTQCIKAMLFLAMQGRRDAYIVAARNVHRAFVNACALLDIDVRWLMPEAGNENSLCSCHITPEGVNAALRENEEKPIGVYLTAPDYLGETPDIAAIAEICHKHGVPLIIDNAHGAYLKFLKPSRHPIDLGADICCDSAHKTLSVLTGGAYLHISEKYLGQNAHDPKAAMALFGSTSPSYLILSSLDLCNKYIYDGYADKLEAATARVKSLAESIGRMGFTLGESDPLKLTVYDGVGGKALAEHLRKSGVEIEFADKNAVVLMLTPENSEADFRAIYDAFCGYKPTQGGIESLPALGCPIRRMSIREAMFAPSERITPREALGRITAQSTISCPPAVPVVISGEEVTREAIEVLTAYEIEYIDVVKE